MTLRIITMGLTLAFALSGCDGSDPKKELKTKATPSPPETPADPAPISPEESGKPTVSFETSVGTIVLELDPENAPITTGNFLSYVNEGFYDGTIFHRVIDGFMIQGGGFALVEGRGTEKKTKDPIKNEAKNGLRNVRGAISMARTSDPDSATSQFFVNVVDNPSLDPKTAANPAGFSPDGYAVFGRVIEGMDIVDKIKQVDTGVKRLQARTPDDQLIERNMENVPLQNVVIKKATTGQ